MKFIKKLAAGALAAVLTFGGSTLAFADEFDKGEIIPGLAVTMVVQNGNTEQNNYLWMNDINGACEEIYYKEEQHVVLTPAPETFDRTENEVKMAAVYLAYYGEYNKSKECQIDVKFTNITVYLELDGYGPYTYADYDSVAAGDNYPTKNNNYAVIYDIKDLISTDGPTRAFILKNLERVEFDIEVSYMYLSDMDVEETTKETTTEAVTVAPTTEAQTTVAPTEAVPETTVAAVETTAVETTEAVENDGKKDNFVLRLVVIVAFALALLGALGAVVVSYVRKK